MLHDLVIAVDLLVPAFIDDALVEDFNDRVGGVCNKPAKYRFVLPLKPIDQSSFDQGRRGRFHFRMDMMERGYDYPSPVAELS
jgi:hypothetical protein